jgi:hypothetical protein
MKVFNLGDRVDVVLKITKRWDSPAGLKNGVVYAYTKNPQGQITGYTVLEDEKTADVDYHRRLRSGCYSIANQYSGYIITATT